MSRVETYSYELLNRREESLGPLDGVTGGTLDSSIYEAIRTVGRIVYHGAPRDWLTSRIRITYAATEDGQTRSWPLGVYLPAAPQRVHGDGDVTTPLSLYDKLLILHEDRFGTTYTVPGGANAVDHCLDVVRGSGETNVVIPANPATVRNDLVFDPGTSRLQVVNAVLDAIGYTSLWCDGNGQYRAEPYTEPMARPLALDLTSGAKAVHLPSFDVSNNTAEVPNRLTLISRTDGDAPALVSTLSLDEVAPDHPLTIAKRGRVVSRVDQDVEAASQAALDALCRRRLLTAANLSQTLEVRHAMAPLTLNDRVRFRDDASGELVEAMCTLVKQTIELTPGVLVRSTLRGVSA